MKGNGTRIVATVAGCVVAAASALAGDPVVKKLPAAAVATTTYVGSWTGLGTATTKFQESVDKAGVKTTGPTTWIFTRGIMDEPDANKYRTEIQVALATPGDKLPAPVGDIRFEKTKVIEVASLDYKGKSADVGGTFQTVAIWVLTNGYEIAGPAREVITRRNADELEAEVQFPVSKPGSEKTASDAPGGRFDMKVRDDFFGGFAGDAAALERGMKTCEDALAKDPGNAEAMVWHGSGLVFESGTAFKKGDQPKGMELWVRGLGEMDKAVALQPENIGVLIPRAATLLAIAQYEPRADASKALVEKAVGDYEKVLQKQEPYFGSLSVHSRGELLVGLGLASHELGRTDKARAYFQRIRKECAGSDYDDLAKGWLDGSSKPALESYTCQGCHTN
ncbi:MAG: hypothetical protein HYR85_25220 [Planctomycetes bacterium]|nr:hypothetical protein [Planctomycetota bacterium]MBI3843319.1 hypothetical protein [Planctomycetota bacterium]